MRTYLSISNFVAAVVLGLAATLMAVPRMIQGGFPLGFFIPAAFIGMTLVAGAATAWSKRGGMCGLFPGWRRALAGAGIAVLVSLLVTPAQCLWIDPRIKEAFANTGNPRLLELRYPATLGGCAAVVLWSAGFETLFFQAAATSFFARLTNGQGLAVVLSVALRVFVSVRQVTEAQVVDAVPLILISTAVLAAVACVLFARAGLIAAMVFSAGLNLHLFLSR